MRLHDRNPFPVFLSRLRNRHEVLEKNLAEINMSDVEVRATRYLSFARFLTLRGRGSRKENAVAARRSVRRNSYV